jgi:hypothetical protein
MDSVVISVRINKKLKDTLEDEGVDLKSEIKAFLAQRALQTERKKAFERLKKLIKETKPSPAGFAVKTVREDRASH